MAFPPGPVSAYPYAVHRPYGFSNSDIPDQTWLQSVAPSSAHLQQTLMGGGAIVPTFATGVSASANSKDDVSSFPCHELPPKQYLLVLLELWKFGTEIPIVERMTFKVVAQRLLRRELLPMFTPASTMHSHATSFGGPAFSL
ncbi:hypothetical protein L1887_24040 [Cichorium endivia]|nr:hypothetical protein L1887_24040 [Cichorium endivia]